MFNKDFLIFSLLTFITIVIWTVLEAYHVHQISTIPANLREQIVELDPTLNTKVIDELKTRYDLASLPTPPQSVIVKLSSPSASLSPTPTSSLQPTPTPAILR